MALSHLGVSEWVLSESSSGATLAATGRMVVYGGAGAETLRVTSASNGTPGLNVLAGGSGNDSYVIDDHSYTVVADIGGSDRIESSGMYFNTTYASIYDNRHLALYDVATNTNVVILDWLDSSRRIETFVGADWSGSLSDLQAVIASGQGFEGYFSLEQGLAYLGWSSITASQMRDAVDEVFARQVALETQPANRAPTIQGASTTLRAGQSLGLTSLFSASDPDGDTLQYLDIEDVSSGTTTRLFTGDLQVSRNMVHTIGYDAATLGTFSLTAPSASGGTVSLRLRVHDGTEWSAWTTATVAVNARPSVTVTGTTADTETFLRLSTLVSGSDPNGDTLSTWYVSDLSDGADSSRLWTAADGYLAQGRSLEVTDLSAVYVRTGTADGADGIRVWAHDGTDWSNSQDLTVQVRRPNTAPRVTVSSGRHVSIARDWLTLSTRVSVSDAENDAITKWEIWDSGTGADSGIAWTGGIGTLTAGRGVEVSAAQFANTWLRGGTTAGTDRIWLRAYDGRDWSAWTALDLESRTANQKPTIDGPERLILINQEWRRLSTLLRGTDAESDTITRYQFSDAGSEGTSGYLWGNGIGTVTAGSTVTVEADNLRRMWVRGGAGTTTETIWARSHDGYDWGDWSQITLVSRPTNAAPTITAANGSVGAKGWKAATDLFSVNDTDGDPAQQLQVWDDTAGGGQFWTQDRGYFAANQGVVLAANELAGLWWKGADSAGSTDTVFVRAHDGVTWGGWKTFSMATVA